MWKNYSLDYIKRNRSSCFSVMTASFIAALFLSLLCSLFYNFWLDNIEGTKREDGDWHSRIIGAVSEDDLSVINRFANVEKTMINETLSKDGQTTVDIYFHNKRTIYQDMSFIMNALNLEESSVTYNFQLLSLYFIRIPGDDKPRLILPLYLVIVAIVCLSLIMIIHNSFAVSMNGRIHQFGIFSSIGATPAQIRTALIQEALALSLVPILIGLLLGLAASSGIVSVMNAVAERLPGGRSMTFSCHPAILTAILFLSLFTILISAWIPAGKLSRLSPLEAIRGTGELHLKKKKNTPFLTILFGMEGELAGNALKAQKKALRTTSLSLTLAFLGFMLTQCFFTLSGISTNHTYFERYQDAWDVMLTVKNTEIKNVKPARKLWELEGLRDCVVYQKAETATILPQTMQSRELLALGGLEALTEQRKASLIIMDERSFDNYCMQIGVTPGQKGTILINRIWDSTGSNFRYPKYIPYVAEDMNTLTLQNTSTPETFQAKAQTTAGGDFQAADQTSAPSKENCVDIPVLALTQEYPVLREEYDNYALVNVIPLSVWNEISGQVGSPEKDTFIRLLSKKDASLENLNTLEQNAVKLLENEYEVESENRIQKKLTNDKMIQGYEMVLGAFCVFLAIIGITHVFSNTLGFLHQRKREFARYMSVGLTPKGIRKIFCIEALIVTGKPILLTLLITTAATAMMIRASYLDPMEFIREAPYLPVSLFILTVFGFVALAYYLGGRKIMRQELAESLRDDTMM